MSHLLYVDDTIVFFTFSLGSGEAQKLCSPQCVLLCFEAILRTKMNLKTSALGPVGEVPNMGTLASILEIVVFYLVWIAFGSFLQD